MLKQNQDSNVTSSSKAKKDTMGTIASIQTLLERYPVLVTVDPKMGTTSFSFMLNILDMLGVTQQDIIDWMCKLLSDKKDGNSGLLVAIEQAVKVVILTSLKEAYTCSVNPVLPDSIMQTPYNIQSALYPCRNEGITVNLNDIDVFGLLNNCPTDRKGSIFYFDTDRDKGYTPANVYSSTDFNAYLWYVINKGAFSTGDEERKRKCVWDNRVSYRNAWEKDGCLIGEPKEDSSKGKFMATSCTNSPTLMIRGVGPKQEFVICEFKESGVNGKNANCLTVYANAYRYYKTGILGKNKTIFEFNADYIAGLKLFDSKTIIAQVTNSLLGITTSLQVNVSIQMQMVTEMVKNIVEKIIQSEDNETIEDCYYTFSNDEYNRLLERAIEKYNGIYPNGDANGGKGKINTEEVLEDIYKIGQSNDLVEETTAIQNIFTSIVNVVSEVENSDNNSSALVKQELGADIIEKFLKEVMVQIVMQVLSPKVMLLYAINGKVLNPEAPSIEGIQSFFENFGNLIVAMVKQIKNIIVQELFDFMMGQLKPLITLFVQKLLLETLTYYRILITELIKNCTFTFNRNNNPLQIDEVSRADIVPIMEQPKTEEKC